MLRITTEVDGAELVFKLEGSLSGPRVAEVEVCLRKRLGEEAGRAMRVDLCGVTFIDGAGKLLLADLHARGATFRASSCATRKIVAEVTGNPA